MTYVEPERTLNAYTCPHCGVYAQTNVTILHQTDQWGTNSTRNGRFMMRQCLKCDGYLLWFLGRLVYPVGIGPVANDDMPPDIRADYDEARSVAAQSPRAAAALLRLAIDKLTARLAPEHAGKRLFDRIGAMVGAGLDPSAQQMLDYVRIAGNGAVHPERIDIPATPELVAVLFGLLNDICNQMLTRPRELAELWATVPESQRTAAEDRDAKALAARATSDAA